MADQADDYGEAELSAALAAHGKTDCPGCGRAIDRGDVAWNNASTEAGTDCIWVEIQCQVCSTGIARWSSWYPGVKNWEEFVDCVLPDWE